MKVYSSHENYETEDTVADVLVDVNNGVLRLGVVESYAGKKTLDAFEEGLSVFSLDDSFWFDVETIDYAFMEVYDNNIDFYHMGGCEVFVKYQSIWYDLYDLIFNNIIIITPERNSPILGDAKEAPLSGVSEVILCTSNSGVILEDLQDNIADDRDFLTDLNFDETNDVRVLHAKFVQSAVAV